MSRTDVKKYEEAFEAFIEMYGDLLEWQKILVARLMLERAGLLENGKMKENIVEDSYLGV